MKAKQVATMFGLAAALCLSATNLLAQDENAGGGQGGGRRQGGGGGGFGGGPGNFDPAQMQQRMMDRIREELNFTNDTDWNAVQPLVQKVMDARRDVGMPGGMGRMFGRNRGDQGGPGGGRRGGMFGQPSAEQEALQKAVEDNAPAAQIKDALAKYRASQQAKEAKFKAAQAELKKVLSVKQEAQAALLGLVD